VVLKVAASRCRPLGHSITHEYPGYGPIGNPLPRASPRKSQDHRGGGRTTKGGGGGGGAAGPPPVLGFFCPPGPWKFWELEAGSKNQKQAAQHTTPELVTGNLIKATSAKLRPQVLVKCQVVPSASAAGLKLKASASEAEAEAAVLSDQ
jgi:hypothetical protein